MLNYLDLNLGRFEVTIPISFTDAPWGVIFIVCIGELKIPPKLFVPRKIPLEYSSRIPVVRQGL